MIETTKKTNDMTNIAIVYFSGSGHTALMAEAVQRGALQAGEVEATLLPIDGRRIVDGRYMDAEIWDRLSEADAIIFGSPTYMGSVAAQFKAFADASAGIWFNRDWKDKLAAGFTHSGSPSGDKLSTLQYLNVFAAQHGMVWVGNADLPSIYHGRDDGFNRLGAFLGVMGAGSQPEGTPVAVESGDLLTAEGLGRRVAEIAKRFQNTRVLAAA